MLRQSQIVCRFATTWLSLALSVLIAGCGLIDDATSPTTPPTSTPNETFSGTLAVQGSNVFSFTVKQTGSISVTLASLSSPSPVAVELAIGTFTSQTSSCKVTSSAPNATAGSTAQMTVTADPGTFCVTISDVGNLTASATFTINIVHS